MPIQHLPTGIDLYYETHGQGDPVMLIPGTAFDANVWLPYQVPALSRSHQVVIFDQRGTGRSTRYRGVYRVEQMACDSIALMDHLGIEAIHVFGHSMGGRIALEMALTFPDRVKSVIMAASGSGVVGYGGRACVQGLPAELAAMIAEKGVEGYVREEIFESGTYFTEGFRKQSPEHVQAFYDTVWPGHSGIEEYIRLCIARHTWEATNRLADVTVPVLVVVGDRDTVGRSHVPQAELLAKGIPGAELLVLKGQSHGFFWEQPEETHAWMLDWFQRHADRATPPLPPVGATVS